MWIGRGEQIAELIGMIAVTNYKKNIIVLGVYNYVKAILTTEM